MTKGKDILGLTEEEIREFEEQVERQRRVVEGVDEGLTRLAGQTLGRLKSSS